MRVCVYPGSFDPFTEGHMDVLRQAVKLFDLVYVGVLDNIAKHPMFSAEDRAEWRCDSWETCSGLCAAGS